MEKRLRLACALACLALSIVALSIVAPASAKKQPPPPPAPTVTTFSAAGVAIAGDSGFGPCAAAVAGNGGVGLGGSGSFHADFGNLFSDAVCAGGPVSLRYVVVGVSTTNSDSDVSCSQASPCLSISVVVTQADPASEVGQQGTIVLQSNPEQASFRIGPHKLNLGPTVVPPFPSSAVDVKIGSANAATVTDYSASGVSVGVGAASGSCAAAVAGTSTLLVDTSMASTGGGAFAAARRAFTPVSPPTTSCGALPTLVNFDQVGPPTTDGETTASVVTAVDQTAPDSDFLPVPPGTPGSASLDESTQSLQASVDGRSGSFGPDHTTTSAIDTRANAEVETRFTGSTICMVNGGGAIAPKNQFNLNVKYRGAGDTPSGHVFYMDKSAGIKFRSDTVSNIVCQGNKATILGTGTADTPSGQQTSRYRVDITDNGNPGKNSDTLSIVLEDVNDPNTAAPYAAGSPLVDGNVHVRAGS